MQAADTVRVKEGQVCPLPSWHLGHARAHLGHHLGQLLLLPPGEWAVNGQVGAAPPLTCFLGWKPGVDSGWREKEEPV